MNSKDDPTLLVPSQEDCDEEEKQEIDDEDATSADQEDREREVEQKAFEAPDVKMVAILDAKNASIEPSEQDNREIENAEAEENDEEAAINVNALLAAAVTKDVSDQPSKENDQKIKEASEAVQGGDKANEEAALDIKFPAAVKNAFDKPSEQGDLKNEAQVVEDKKGAETKSDGRTTTVVAANVASLPGYEKYYDGKPKEDLRKIHLSLPKSNDTDFPMKHDDHDIEEGRFGSSNRSLELVAGAAAAAANDSVAIHDELLMRANSKQRKGVVRISSSGGRRERATEPGAEYVAQRAPGLSMRWYLDRRRLRSEAVLRENEAAMVQEQPVINMGSSASPSLSLPLPSSSSSPMATVAYSQWSHHSKLQSRRRYYIGAAALVVVIMIGIAVGVTIWYKDSHHGQNGDGTTKFDAYTYDCSILSSQINPHVLTQCHCNGQITTVPNDVKERYHDLSTFFITSVFPDFQESIDSCHARNQALLWLASGDGDALNSPTGMRQRYSLALFFILLQGPTWTVRNSWLSSDHECAWFGLSCDNHQEQVVVSIVLSINNLSGELPQDMALLTSLQSFDLSGNQLQGQMPNEVFGNLTRLTSVTLDGNQFNGTLPISLSELSMLQTLQLSSNQLEGPIPTEFGHLSYLRTIDLKLNQLTGQLPTEIGLWNRSIEIISLTSNQLNGSTIPTQFGLLTHLSTLAIDSNGLQGTIPTELFNVGSSLSILNLGMNQLVGTIPTQVGLVMNISGLWLQSNRLTGTIPTELGLAINIGSLDVSFNRLTGTIPSELGMVARIAYLNLEGNHFNGTIPDSVCAVANPIYCTDERTCRCCQCELSIHAGGETL